MVMLTAQELIEQFVPDYELSLRAWPRDLPLVTAALPRNHPVTHPAFPEEDFAPEDRPQAWQQRLEMMRNRGKAPSRVAGDTAESDSWVPTRVPARVHSRRPAQPFVMRKTSGCCTCLPGMHNPWRCRTLGRNRHQSSNSKFFEGS